MLVQNIIKKIPDGTKIYVKYWDKSNHIMWANGLLFNTDPYLFLYQDTIFTYKINKSDIIAVVCSKKHIIKKNFILW